MWVLSNYYSGSLSESGFSFSLGLGFIFYIDILLGYYYYWGLVVASVFLEILSILEVISWRILWNFSFS